MIWPIETSKAEVNRLLGDFFKENIAAAKRLDDDYALLWTTTERFVMTGGKRLRPHLCILAYQAFGGALPESVAPIAAAQELLHVALLVHDDIIDRDYVRYGVDNIAGRQRKAYASENISKDETDHLADGAALLAGDLLLSGAHDIMTQSQLPPAKLSQAQHQLHQAMFHVAGGELLDTEAVLKNIQEVDTVKIMELKTAHYSFISPLLTGARLADASEADLKILVQYGLHLGVAYQLTDDLLGVFGDEATIGKPVSSDLQESKRTYLAQETLKRANKAGHQLLQRTIEKRRTTSKDFAALRQLMIDSGAVEAVQTQAQTHAAAAIDVIRTVPMNHEAIDALRDLATKIIDTSQRSISSFGQ